MIHALRTIRRIGRPAAVARRAARLVADRQMPQAYPPQRGISKRAIKEKAPAADHDPMCLCEKPAIHCQMGTHDIGCLL